MHLFFLKKRKKYSRSQQQAGLNLMNPPVSCWEASSEISVQVVMIASCSCCWWRLCEHIYTPVRFTPTQGSRHRPATVVDGVHRIKEVYFNHRGQEQGGGPTLLGSDVFSPISPLCLISKILQLNWFSLPLIFPSRCTHTLIHTLPQQRGWTHFLLSPPSLRVFLSSLFTATLPCAPRSSRRQIGRRRRRKSAVIFLFTYLDFFFLCLFLLCSSVSFLGGSAVTWEMGCGNSSPAPSSSAGETGWEHFLLFFWN